MKTQQNLDFSYLHKSTENMSLIENKGSGSKNKYDFDAWRNTGTLLGALDYMLQVIYSGEYASEIWHCFRMSDKYQPSYRFSWQPLVCRPLYRFSWERLIGRKEDSGHLLTNEEQIQATFCADQDKVILNYLLQLHRIGKSNMYIQKILTYFGYWPSEEIIQELITISEKRPRRHDFCEETQEWQVELLPRLPDDVLHPARRFLSTLIPMLQKFLYFGESTEETRLVFLNAKRRFYSSFLNHFYATEPEEVKATITCYMARYIVALKYMLQSHYIGKDAWFIYESLEKHRCFFSPKLIQEIINIAKEPDEGDLMRHKLHEACPEKESDQTNDGE